MEKLKTPWNLLRSGFNKIRDLREILWSLPSRDSAVQGALNHAWSSPLGKTRQEKLNRKLSSALSWKYLKPLFS